jgi:hypothetical protein
MNVTLKNITEDLKNYKVHYEDTITWATGDIVDDFPVYYMEVKKIDNYCEHKFMIEEDKYIIKFYKIRNNYWGQFYTHYNMIVFMQSKLRSFNPYIPYYDWTNYNYIITNRSYIFENYHEKILSKLRFVDYNNIKYLKKERKKLLILFIGFNKFDIPNEMVFHIFSFCRLLDL